MFFYGSYFLSQAARNALRGEDVLIQMSEDWAALDLRTVVAQTLYAIEPLDVPQQYIDMVPHCEFNIFDDPLPYSIMVVIDDPVPVS